MGEVAVAGGEAGALPFPARVRFLYGDTVPEGLAYSYRGMAALLMARALGPRVVRHRLATDPALWFSAPLERQVKPVF